MTQKELKEGKIFTFGNEEFQIKIRKDDIRWAEVMFEEAVTGGKFFKIWFNGSLIHMSKTFQAMERRLNNLINDWHLKPTN